MEDKESKSRDVTECGDVVCRNSGDLGTYSFVFDVLIRMSAEARMAK